MRTTTFFLALTLLLVGQIVRGQDRKGEKTITFSVDMHCESCAKKIQNHIAYEKGVRDLKISLEEKEVSVTYKEGKTTPETLKKSFEKIGYKAVTIEKDKEIRELGRKKTQ